MCSDVFVNSCGAALRYLLVRCSGADIAAVFPSDLAGPLLKDIKTSDKAMTEEGAFPRSFIPAERLGSEEDMAGSILYLASKAGSYLNGSVVLVDGGRISTQPATY